MSKAKDAETVLNGKYFKDVPGYSVKNHLQQSSMLSLPRLEMTRGVLQPQLALLPRPYTYIRLHLHLHFHAAIACRREKPWIRLAMSATVRESGPRSDLDADADLDADSNMDFTTSEEQDQQCMHESLRTRKAKSCGQGQKLQRPSLKREL